MRMRDLFTITEDEGTAPVSPSSKPKGNGYQNKLEKRTRFQGGTTGRMQTPSPDPEKVKPAASAAPVEGA